MTKIRLQIIRIKIIDITKQLQRLRDRLGHEMAKATNTASNSNSEPVQGGISHSKVQVYSEKVDEIAGEIVELKTERASLEDEVREAVKKLSVMSAKILFYYYAKGYPWRAVANICGVSRSHAKGKLHNEAIAQIINYTPTKTVNQ